MDYKRCQVAGQLIPEPAATRSFAARRRWLGLCWRNVSVVSRHSIFADCPKKPSSLENQLDFLGISSNIEPIYVLRRPFETREIADRHVYTGCSRV